MPGCRWKDLREKLAGLNLAGEFELKAYKVSKNGFGATKVDVIVHEHPHGRHLAEIEAILQKSSLPGHIQEKAAGIFRRLAEVEAGIHGQPVEQVHLHEVGGVDTIMDVVGTLLGLEELGVQRVYASPLPLGRGFVQGAHGQIPLPAPATRGPAQGCARAGQ